MEADMLYVGVTHTCQLIGFWKVHFPPPDRIAHIYKVILNASLNHTDSITLYPHIRRLVLQLRSDLKGKISGIQVPHNQKWKSQHTYKRENI